MVLGFAGGTVIRGSSHLKELNFELFLMGFYDFAN